MYVFTSYIPDSTGNDVVNYAQVFLSHKNAPSCLTSTGEWLIVNGGKSKKIKKIPSKWTASDRINKTRFDNCWKINKHP